MNPGSLRAAGPLATSRTMKAKDATILFVPDRGETGDGHWLRRWQTRLSTGRRVDFEDADNPRAGLWLDRLRQEIDRADGAVVLVGHGLGAGLVALAAPELPDRVRGAFLVAPPDLGDSGPDDPSAFGRYGRDPFPFPSIVIASRTDPHCSFETAEDLAAAWGSLLIDGGDIGRINEESGHGPWPEGSLTFARFVSRLPE